MTIAESIQLNKEQIARAFGVPTHMLADPDRTVAPRYWSLCMTGENYGEVGPAGSAFQHRGEKHERVLVVELPTAAGAPADQINLRLVGARHDLPVAEFEGYVDGEPLVRWMDRDNMPRVGTKLYAGVAAAVDAAAPAIGSASHRAAVDHALKAAQAWANEEYVCARNLGQGGPGTHAACDAKQAACIAAIDSLAAPVAAQAGHDDDADVTDLEVRDALGDQYDPEVGEAVSVLRVMAAWKAEAELGAKYKQMACGTAQAAPLPAGHERIADIPRIEITLRQAKELVTAFGRHDAEVSIFQRLPAWSDMPDGLYAFFNDDPDAGSIYLGPTDVDDDLAINGEQAGPTCTCPSGDGSLRWPCDVHPPAALASTSGEHQEGGAT